MTITTNIWFISLLNPAVRQTLIWFPFSDEMNRPGQSCTVISWRLETPSSTVFPLAAVFILHIGKEAKAVLHFSSLFPYLFVIDLSVLGKICMCYKQYFLERGELSSLQSYQGQTRRQSGRNLKVNFGFSPTDRPHWQTHCLPKITPQSPVFLGRSLQSYWKHISTLDS